MEQLERFKDLNIKIICPLSYGGENNYVREVEDYGKKLFGNKFIPLKNFIPPGEYAKILREVDVALFNHKRQQALGTVLSLLYVGAKVFIRVETTSFDALSRLGLKLFPIEELGKLDFNDFIFIDNETKASNKKAVGREFSNENYVRIWKNLFKDAQLKKIPEFK